MVKRLIFSVALMCFGFLVGLAYSMATIASPAAVGAVQESGDSRLVTIVNKQYSDTSHQLNDIRESLRMLRAEVGRGAAAPREEAPPARAPSFVPGQANERAGRLAVLKSWKDDAALRTKWTSATAADVKRWFGAPDEVAKEADGETWTYLQRDADKVTATYKVSMKAGRVSEVQAGEPKERCTGAGQIGGKDLPRVAAAALRLLGVDQRAS
jgi:hypothetical protein